MKYILSSKIISGLEFDSFSQFSLKLFKYDNEDWNDVKYFSLSNRM